MDLDKVKMLKKMCIKVREDSIKTQKIAGSGHLGGAFSATEIMVYLYFDKMNIDPQNSLKENRDIFVLSKGHASVGYYSVLARRGFFPLDELKTYRQINSRLQGHTHMDDAPGIECSTGSLGQGLSFGIGLALGYKKKGLHNIVYVMLGDGELEEGQVWEAILLQGYLKLDNLVTIVDSNKLQLDDFVNKISGINRLKEKFESFDFNVIEIDGHDLNDIDYAFNSIENCKANVVIANTIKGKGISFMENGVEWHSKKPNEVEYIKALEELKEQEALINE